MRPSTAVIIGAGISGLLCARSLSEFFSDVLILERDSLPAGPSTRPGVPQSAHAHVLLVRGKRILSELFPGIDKSLLDGGAIEGDICADTRVSIRGRRLPRFESELKTMAASRNLLEWQIRLSVSKLDNVTIRENCRVTGLVLDGARSQVCGVSCVMDKSHQTNVPADLVIDCSGSGSKTAGWLTDQGFDSAKTEVVDAQIGYASRRYRRSQIWPENWKAAAIAWWPPRNQHAGAIYPEENETWVVSLAGAMDSIPGTSEEKFAAHAVLLEDTTISEQVCKCEPISKIRGYRLPGNRRFHFSKLRRKPKRLIVIGDALCFFNPFYGQGMTVAAMQAEEIRRSLKSWQPSADNTLDRCVSKIQRACETVLTVPWLLATCEDFRHGNRVVGRKTVLHRIAIWYTNRAMLTRTPRSTRALFETMSMVRPWALIKPGVIFDVMVSTLFPRLVRDDDG